MLRTILATPYSLPPLPGYPSLLPEPNKQPSIKSIEESGGYNIIVSTKILDGTMYKIDKGLGLGLELGLG